jgi:xanthine dehydrogenase iron-sulfur cluster and FAD-binding subunit A
VRLDGRQVCACLVSAAQVQGCEVRTIEGLSNGAGTSALQRAFLVHGAAQCGICTPGMLMAADDLLARNPRPSEAEVMDALGGVLCRCTGYRKIVEAVLAVASDPAFGWHGQPASFDKLRMRVNLGGTTNVPHPELVEGRSALIRPTRRPPVSVSLPFVPLAAKADARPPLHSDRVT